MFISDSSYHPLHLSYLSYIPRTLLPPDVWITKLQDFSFQVEGIILPWKSLSMKMKWWQDRKYIRLVTYKLLLRISNPGERHYSMRTVPGQQCNGLHTAPVAEAAVLRSEQAPMPWRDWEPAILRISFARFGEGLGIRISDRGPGERPRCRNTA